ncbi:MAG: hypothetical protein AAFN77_23315 [Planctomycetota bacterium]
MNDDLDLTPVSSQLGRQWLVDSLDQTDALPVVAEKVSEEDASRDATDSIDQTQNPQSKSNQVRILSIAVPDVSALPSLAPELVQPGVEETFEDGTNASIPMVPVTDPKSIVKKLADVTEQRLEAVSSRTSSSESTTVAEAEPPAEEWIREQERTADRTVPTVPTTNPQQASTFTQSTTSESSDRIEVANTSTAATASPKDRSAGINGDQDETQQLTEQLDGVVESILARATPGQSTLILFVGTESNPHVDATTAMVGSILTRKRHGSVLLVDSHADSKQLSVSSGAANQPGLVESVLESKPWSGLIRKGAATGIDFLPYGIRRLDGTRFQARVRQLTAELKQSYDYICVSAGAAESVDARIWSDISDGCYLLVSQKNSNPTLAQSAVAELQSCGARLLGCVVTDV